MGANSQIGWTDHTMNFWIGCSETSPACDHCYARDLSERYGWAEWGPGEPRHRTSEANWKKPYQWDRAAKALGIRPRVFSLSLGDWADQEIPRDWREDMETVVDETPNLDWLLLSKRHGPVEKWCRARIPKHNVRIGFTVENREWAQARLYHLQRIAALGWNTFVSYEPALEGVDFSHWLNDGTIQWLICGAESGSSRRPFDLDWARSCRDACQAAEVPFFLKQIPGGPGPKHVIEGPELDGKQWQEFPRPVPGQI